MKNDTIIVKELVNTFGEIIKNNEVLEREKTNSATPCAAYHEEEK